MQCSQGRLAGDLNADDPPDLILQLQHLVDVGKQAGMLLQALQSVPVIAPASPGQARPSTSSSAEREPGTCNPVNDGPHDAEGDPASPEMDIFDDECIWTKSQLKRSMFGGEVSAADADAIQAHLDRASPLFEPSTDCAVCLLEKDDGAHPALFRLPCCSIEVHLACINRCLGSRGIQNVCPACRAQVPDDVARAVLAAFKANKRARGKRRR